MSARKQYRKQKNSKNAAYKTLKQRFLRESKRYNEASSRLDKLLKECTDDYDVIEKYIARVRKIESLILSTDEIDSEWYKGRFQNAFILLLEHFGDRISDFNNCKGNNRGEIRHRRTKIIVEIDKSISLFWRMIEQESQSLWNANRVVNPANPGIAAISYVSPKLYAYYSNMLNCLSDVYSDSVHEYAFCVNPIPGGEYQANVLFEDRSQHGKVCIIDLPEKSIANVKDNRFLLMHEFYHVLPREVRNRKERYGILYNMISRCVADYYSLNENNVPRIENMDIVLEELIKSNSAINGMSAMSNENRIFYSKNTQESLCKLINTSVSKLTMENPCDYLWAKIIKKKEHMIEPYRWDQIRRCMMSKDFSDQCMKILADLRYGLDSGEIQRFVETVVIISRETFADLLAILTLQISPEEYIRVLDENCRVKLSEKMSDGYIIKMRLFFVMETMKAVIEKHSADAALRFVLAKWKIDISDLALDNSLYKSFVEMIKIHKQKGPIWERMIKDNDARSLIISYFEKCIEDWIKTRKIKANKFAGYYKENLPDINMILKSGLSSKATDIGLLENISLR